MARSKKSKPPKNISNSSRPLVDQQDEEEDYELLGSLSPSGVDEGKSLSYALYYDFRQLKIQRSTLGNPSNVVTHPKTTRKVNPRVQARKERDHWGINIQSFSFWFLCSSWNHSIDLWGILDSPTGFRGFDCP